MGREGVEDYKRHRLDNTQNRRKCVKLTFEKEEEVEWAHLAVGDILLIRKDMDFPADLVLLSSSNPDASLHINTSSLDGEKTLKPKVHSIPLARP